MKVTPLLMIFCLVGIFVFIHELTHVVIFDYYDCEDVVLHYAWKGVGIAADWGSCKEGVELAQSMNEIIGYNVMPYLILIFWVLVVKRDKND